MPKGGVAVIHVEDLAEGLARMVVPGRGPRRFMLGGDFLTWTELADLCDELTGVRCRRMVVPGWLLVALGAALDLAKRIKPFDYPLTRDAAEVMVSMVPTDDTATNAALGLERRPARDSIEEALRCLAADGHLAPEKAGRLAAPGAVSPSKPPTRHPRVVRPARHPPDGRQRALRPRRSARRPLRRPLRAPHHRRPGGHQPAVRRLARAHHHRPQERRAPRSPPRLRPGGDGIVAGGRQQLRQGAPPGVDRPTSSPTQRPRWATTAPRSR